MRAHANVCVGGVLSGNSGARKLGGSTVLQQMIGAYKFHVRKPVEQTEQRANNEFFFKKEGQPASVTHLTTFTGSS